MRNGAPPSLFSQGFPMPKICIVCATMFDQTSNGQKSCSENCQKILIKKRRRRYNQSEKGKATNKRSNKRYLKSEKGKKTRKSWSKKYGKLYYQTERGRFLIHENKKKIRRKQKLAYAVIKSLGIPLNVEQSDDGKKYQEKITLSYNVVKSLGIQL
jgi:hypothetical protein